MRLFISYAHVDRAIVEDWIVKTLRTGGHEVWFDDRLTTGQNWQAELDAEIQKSDALVFTMTPESVTSEWCLWELQRAIDLDKPIIPVLLQAETPLPQSLQTLQFVDFTQGATSNAVARLMNGLQRVTLMQLPPAPSQPQGIPAQAEIQEQANQNILIKILRDPAFQAIGTIIGILIAAIALLTQLSNSAPPSITPTMRPEPTDVRPTTSVLPTVIVTTEAPPTSTIAPTQTPTNPPPPVEVDGTSYPCEATINPNLMATSVEIRELPNSRSRVVASIARGAKVTIVDRSGGNNVLYQIRHASSGSIGWVDEEYLVLSPACPS